MSGAKVLTLELETKARCENDETMANVMNKFHKSDLVQEDFNSLSYNCCASSCCNYNERTANLMRQPSDERDKDRKQWDNNTVAGPTGKIRFSMLLILIMY